MIGRVIRQLEQLIVPGHAAERFVGGGSDA